MEVIAVPAHAGGKKIETDVDNHISRNFRLQAEQDSPVPPLRCWKYKLY